MSITTVYRVFDLREKLVKRASIKYIEHSKYESEKKLNSQSDKEKLKFLPVKFTN